MLRILYRGPLASCNYGCQYCPFAKQVDSRGQLATDAAKLERLVAWVGERRKPTSVFFTPWGEALIRRPYQRALATLTHLPHLGRAAIQTNLSCPIDWLDECAPSKLGIWATYHPEWTELSPFVNKIAVLAERGVSVSAGVVGFKQFAEEIEGLRAALPKSVYVWINANKRDPGYYSEADIARFEGVDPHFRTNTIRHSSLGKACAAGDDVISVDGDGTMRRCHFIAAPIGNIYERDYDSALKPRACSNDTCGCHIGYVHLEKLGLRKLYGDGLLERVPAQSSLASQTSLCSSSSVA